MSDRRSWYQRPLLYLEDLFQRVRHTTSRIVRLNEHVHQNTDRLSTAEAQVRHNADRLSRLETHVSQNSDRVRQNTIMSLRNETNVNELRRKVELLAACMEMHDFPIQETRQEETPC